MRYLTDYKRAVGRGAARTGTAHHWAMTVSSVALALLIPPFIYIVGSALGQGHAAVVETFARPVPAIVTALTLVVGLHHFRMGAEIWIDDYLRGTARKAALIAAAIVSYAAMATGLFALARIAF
jgi:succinate dehydrogenase / fumarate reductase membrane anchor subunit